MKKIISFIFVLIMCFSCFSLTVFAEGEELPPVEDAVEKTYTITFDTLGGVEIEPINYNKLNEVLTLPNAEKKGYAFKGWYENDVKVENIQPGQERNLHLTAKWGGWKYLVTFSDSYYSEETILPKIEYTIEDEDIDLTKPEYIPTKEGYKFLGWYVFNTREKIEKIYVEECTPYRLYAKWEEIKEEIEEPKQEEVVYPCKVKVLKSEFGDVVTEIDAGNIGDVVTFKVKPYILYKVTSVKVNGVDLLPNEDGFYSFSLVEGDNNISVEYQVDNEQLEIIAINLANAKKGNWEDIFSMDNLYKLIDWVITIFFSCGFLTVLLKNKKIQAKTTDDVVAISKKAVEDKTIELVNDFLENKFAPVVTKIDSKLVGTEEVCKTLARCFILSQENTPESRLAIISELANVQKTENDLSKQVKAVIFEEMKKMQEVQKKKEDTIKELEEKNESINPEVKDNGRI